VLLSSPQSRVYGTLFFDFFDFEVQILCFPQGCQTLFGFCLFWCKVFYELSVDSAVLFAVLRFCAGICFISFVHYKNFSVNRSASIKAGLIETSVDISETHKVFDKNLVSLGKPLQGNDNPLQGNDKTL
jgi:hypothetical protein